MIMVVYTKDKVIRAWDTREEAAKYLTEEEMKELSDDGLPPREKMNLDDYDRVQLTATLWTLVRKQNV
jgi:hypothetical protein